MSDFWWGVLALPLGALTLSAAVAALFGSWLLLEKWATSRWRKLEPVKLPEAFAKDLDFWTVGDLGKRGAFASIVLAGGTVRMLRIGSGAIFLVGGKPDEANSRMIQRALQKALLDVAKAEKP